MEKVGRGGGRRWAIDMKSDTSSSSRDVADPPGYSPAAFDQDESALSRQKKEVDSAWKQQKAWEVAQAPFKNLFMMGFMMWMAGNTVHLFSIGITVSALWQPISALKGVGKFFEPYQDAKTDTLLPKVVYILLNVAGLLLGLWKMVEFSGGGSPFN